MELLNKIVNEHTIISVGLTIIKSIWIGAIISVLTAVLSTLVKKSARTRYIIAATGLLIIFISSVAVFIDINNDGQQAFADTSFIIDASTIQPTDGYDEVSHRFKIPAMILGLTRDAERLFIYHSELIVLIWIIGVFILSIKFTGGYIYTRRLRSRITTDIPAIWAARIGKIAEKIKLKTKIRTVKSAVARIPMVTGWLKPVVILPASLLSGIPVEQVEAIIAHELAHIKRNDYLVNIFQSFIEIVMFFNPSVWWISGMIRRERENCCDDIALAAGTESVVYAKALVSIREISLPPPAPAVAIIKNNNNLLNRIKRITAMKKNNNTSKGNFTAVLGIGLLVSALVALTAFNLKPNNYSRFITEKSSTESYNTRESFPESTNQLYLLQDTVRQKESSTIRTTWTDPADNTKKEVRMSIKDGQVIELIIDGEIIPEEDYPIYQDLIDDTIQDYETALKEIEDLDVEEIERDIEEAMLELEAIDMEEMEKEIQEAMLELETIDMEEVEKDIQEAMLELETIDMEEMEKDIQEAMLELETIDMEEMEKDIQEAMQELETIDMEEVEKDIQEAMQELETIDMEEIKKEIKEAIKELEEIDMKEIEKEIKKARKKKNN